MQTDNRKMVVVRCGGEFFGLEIHKVLSIEKMQPITKIPTNGDIILGVINLRESVIPVLDLKKILFQKPTQLSDENRIIAVHFEERLIGLVVEESKHVLDITKEQVSELEYKDLLSSKLEIIKTDNELIVLLDINQILNDEEYLHTLENFQKQKIII